MRNVAATLAHDALAGYYKGNVSGDPLQVGDLQDPYYWWVAGALWGTLLDYYHYTKDPTYNDVVIEALLSPPNIGPNFDYVPPEHAGEEGNDDLFFWGTAAMAAAERNFPQPDESIPSWLEITENVFNSLLSRWDESKCGGGLLWQIYADNPNGLTYKNSISNGGFFQLATRLARATGNETYSDWATKVWDWSWDIGLVDHEKYAIYDGTDITKDCAEVNHQSFTYTSGVYMYGAAVMANYTGDEVWVDRAARLLDGADWFFSPFENATDVMYEAACETVNSCNADMSTHKSYLARAMWSTAQMQPALRPKIEERLAASALAAASSCTGGDNGNACGMRWYLGGFDGQPGLGQQMTALETIQGWLIDQAEAPLMGEDIKTIRETNWAPIDTYEPDPTTKGKKPLQST